MTTPTSFAAFAADRLIARGPLTDVLAAVKLGHFDGPAAQLLIFDNNTGRQTDFDLRGTLEETLGRLDHRNPPKRVGRPKLGVESRELSLLPRHWEWLARQPGGASAAVRRLVEHAAKGNGTAQEARQRRDATYSVMSTMAGDRPGFEEATRALFAGDNNTFEMRIAEWPADIQEQLRWMLETKAGSS